MAYFDAAGNWIDDPQQYDPSILNPQGTITPPPTGTPPGITPPTGAPIPPGTGNGPGGDWATNAPGSGTNTPPGTAPTSTGYYAPGATVPPAGGAPGAATSQEDAMKYAIGTLGLKGQAAVDWLQQNYPQFNVYGSGVQYYPGTNTYGGNGWYASPGAGQYGYDWIARSAGGGGGAPGGGAGSGGSGTLPTMGSMPVAPTIPSSINLSNEGDIAALVKRLGDLSNQSLNIDKNDPIIKNQTDIYGAEETQQMRKYLQGLGESAGPYKNLSSESRNANEQVAQDTAGFEGRLMAQELTARRNQIMQALQMESGVLTQEQAMKLQGDLALINDQLQLYGVNVGANEFWANLGQNAFQFDSSLQARYAGV